MTSVLSEGSEGRQGGVACVAGEHVMPEHVFLDIKDGARYQGQCGQRGEVLQQIVPDNLFRATGSWMADA